MVNRNVAVVANAPPALDGAQAEIEFLPAEEQCLVVAIPRGAADGMSGADEGDRVE
jgi:hypothetical protein